MKWRIRTRRVRIIGDAAALAALSMGSVASADTMGAVVQSEVLDTEADTINNTNSDLLGGRSRKYG
jgi:hypothetical protein